MVAEQSIVVAGLLLQAYRTPIMPEAIAVCTSAGGAAGNIANRLLNGAVTNCLDFYTGVWHSSTLH
ncbi:hypothetical protein RMS29_026970 (plasmid) [Agrobacterium rosae]